MENNNAINQSLINEYRSLKSLKAEIDERLSEIENLVKNEMDSQGVAVLFIGDGTAHYTETLRGSFDTKAFKLFDIETYNRFVKQNPVKRFTLK